MTSYILALRYDRDELLHCSFRCLPRFGLLLPDDLVPCHGSPLGATKVHVDRGSQEVRSVKIHTLSMFIILLLKESPIYYHANKIVMIPKRYQANINQSVNRSVFFLRSLLMRKSLFIFFSRTVIDSPNLILVL